MSALIFFFLVMCTAAANGEFEPKCSKFDFEERTLEKLVRLEHQMELHTARLEKMEKRLENRQEKMEHDKIKALEQLSKAREHLVKEFDEMAINLTEEQSRQVKKIEDLMDANSNTFARMSRDLRTLTNETITDIRGK